MFNTTVFVSCAGSFRGSNAVELAKQRCCVAGDARCSQLMNATEWSTDNQCPDGYTGVICRSCRLTDHVPLNNQCRPCPGGPAPMDTVVAMIIGSSIFGFIMFILLLKTNFMERTLSTHSRGRIYGQIKIIISFLQICSSYTVAYDQVPWPDFFKDFSLGLGFINLDFLYVLAGSKCNMALPFLDRFLIHMAAPPMMIFALFLAYVMASFVVPCCVPIKEALTVQMTEDLRTRKKQLQYRMSIKIAIFIMLLLYPGLATSLFLMLRCEEIPEVGLVLEQDYSVFCFTFLHGAYMSLVGIFMAMYVFGIPFFVFLVLHRNRKHLHDRKSIYYEEVRMKYGGLYVQYEQPYWWFEMTTLFYKMVITGALSIASPGTPLQLILANLVMLMYMLLVLRTMPYVHDVDDWMSFLTSLVLVLTTFAGFVLVMDAGWQEPSFDSNALGLGLVILNLATLIMQVLHVMLMRCKLGNNVTKRCGCKDRTEDEDENENENENENQNQNQNPNPNPNQNQNQNQNQNSTAHNNTHIVPTDLSNIEANDFSIMSNHRTTHKINKARRAATIWETREKIERVRSTKRKVTLLHKEHRQSQIMLEKDINNKKALSKDRLNQRIQARQQLQRFKVMKILEQTAAFSSLSETAVKTIVNAMEYNDYVLNDVLCLQGDIADRFFVIVEGVCKVTVLRSSNPRKTATLNNIAVKTDEPDENEDDNDNKDTSKANELRVGTLRENQCFGDAAIPKLTTERMKEELGDVNLHLHHANKGIRAATVTAISDKVKVLCLSTNQFAILMKDGVIGAKTLNSLYKTKDEREDLNEALLMAEGEI